MLCPNCGKELHDTDLFCGYCGFKVIAKRTHCPNCGNEIGTEDRVCSHCGFQLPLQQTYQVSQKSHLVAGFLGLFFGGVGAHNFYLGYSSKGFFQIVLFLAGIFTFGLTSMISIIWGLVEAILIFTGSIDRDGDDNPMM